MNAKDERGDRPLHAATIENDASMVKILINDARAAVDAKNNREQTALHIASELGFAEIIQLLLSYGADPSVRERKGRTALYIAARGSHTAIVDLLIKAERDQSGDRKYSISSISSQILITSNIGVRIQSELDDRFGGQVRDQNNRFQVKKKPEIGKNVSIETTDTQVTNGCESINSMSESNYNNTNCESFSRSMKDLLRFLSKNHLSSPEDWKKLAYYWKFTPEQVSAIEHQV